MITYTRRNVSFLAASLTLFIFIIFHLCYLPQVLQNQNGMFFSKQIYSKRIANNLNTVQTVQKENFLQTVHKENSSNFNQKSSIPLVQKEENAQMQEVQDPDQVAKQENKTQRQVLEENKNNTWRIQIPKINLDVHIKEGTTSIVMLQAVGHFEETSKWNGNIGLAAHNRGYQCNFFQNIKNLNIGDEIIYMTANGKKVYQVQINKVIKETDWSYLENTKDNRITLITCEENRSEYRRCIQAVEVASYK